MGWSEEGKFRLLSIVARDWSPLGSIRRMELANTGDEITVLLDGTIVLQAVDDLLLENTYVGVFAKGETETS